MGKIDKKRDTILKIVLSWLEPFAHRNLCGIRDYYKHILIKDEKGWQICKVEIEGDFLKFIDVIKDHTVVKKVNISALYKELDVKFDMTSPELSNIRYDNTRALTFSYKVGDIFLRLKEISEKSTLITLKIIQDSHNNVNLDTDIKNFEQGNYTE